MILIKNRQRTYPVEKQQIKKIVEAILEYLGYHEFDIGIMLTNNKTIAHYNEQYRHKMGPTDILSFPYYAKLQVGQKIIPKGPEDANLGDLIISMEFIDTHTRWADIPEHQRLPILLVHGICHLLGYDHETDSDYRKMHKKEEELLEMLRAKSLYK